MKSTQEIINNISAIVEKTIDVFERRKFSLGITNVYYVGGTLCIDIYKSGSLKFLIMVNISTETFTVFDKESGREHQRLLPLKAVKSSFDVYEKTKGKTDYYKRSFDNSCLAHLN